MTRKVALLVLMLLYVVPSSAKAVTSVSTSSAIYEDSSAVHTRSLTLTGTLSTVAGSLDHFKRPTPAINLHGMAATAAKLNQIRDVAVDAAGNLFISTDGEMILQVTASTGIITVVAGTGVRGFSGDGALAIHAELDSPCGIAVDKFGNIFVADKNNQRIRKITVSTGIITTVAGASAGFAVPYDKLDVGATTTAMSITEDVAVDTFGNIYIVCTWSHPLRKITASTGIISGLTGYPDIMDCYVRPTLPALGVAATASTFCRPSSITVDASGNVFFTDTTLNSIYKIAVNTGLLTLVAGSNYWYYGNNGDDIAATAALLNGPTDITVDALGNIFFSDSGNNHIRKITASTGIITTVVGLFTGVVTTAPSCYKSIRQDATSVSLCDLRGVAVDKAGSIYFSQSRELLSKVTYSEKSPSSAATRAPSVTPVPSITGSPTTAAPQPVSTPTAVALSGIIYTVAGSESSGIALYGYGIAATSVTLGNTEGVAVDAAGNLFISTYGDIILKVTASTGIITLVAGTGVRGFSGDGALAIHATLESPRGIAVDKFGDIFVADEGNNRIRKITVSTGIITTVAGSADIVVDSVAATKTRLNSPQNVAVDTFGNIYITDTWINRLRKVTASTGIITTIAGTTYSYAYAHSIPTSATLGVAATASDFFSLSGITVDTSGNVFFTDTSFHSIYKIAANTGLLTLVAGSNKLGILGNNGDDIAATAALLNGPTDITVDALGNIFFSDSGNNRIRKITASTGIITRVAGKASVSPRCYTSGLDGNGEDATLKSLCSPLGIAVDAAGNIYFADHKTVRKVTYSEARPLPSVTMSPTAASRTPTPTPTVRPTSTPTPTPSASAIMISVPLALFIFLVLALVLVCRCFSNRPSNSGDQVEGEAETRTAEMTHQPSQSASASASAPYAIAYTASQVPSAQATLISPDTAAMYETATAVVIGDSV